MGLHELVLAYGRGICSDGYQLLFLKCRVPFEFGVLAPKPGQLFIRARVAFAGESLVRVVLHFTLPATEVGLGNAQFLRDLPGALLAFA